MIAHKRDFSSSPIRYSSGTVRAEIESKVILPHCRTSIDSPWGLILRRNEHDEICEYALITFMIIVLAGGCSEKKPTEMIPDSSNTLSSLSIFSRVESDTPGTKSITIRIANKSRKTVDDVRITLNKAYSSDLKDLLVYHGFWEGTKTLGRSKIFAEEELQFIFSHDISNHDILKDSRGNPLPNTSDLSNVMIRTSESKGLWHK
ncbi:MAG: hypothetical protein ACI97A_002039 [Planctomycetota bacterium]|jgi:hypothetical protein